jgi:hypothetical protein
MVRRGARRDSDRRIPHPHGLRVTLALPAFAEVPPIAAEALV